jgi:LysM repeat protein
MIIQVPPAVPPTATPIPTPEIVQPVYIPPDATFGFCYRTQPGETIDVLAQKYGTNPWAINRANDLHEPYFIKPQQTIFVPVLPGNGPNVYPVELGDTLAIIAERCKIPERMLARVNNLQPGDPIYQPAGSVVPVADGTSQILAHDTAIVRNLIIPIPPFPPPSRYQYPTGPIPIVPMVPPGTPYPIRK